MKWKKIIVGAIIVGFIIMFIDIIIGGIFQFIFPYNIFELGGMRKIDDPIMFLFFIHPWILGFCLSFIYSYFEKGLNGNYFSNGLKFGLLMWIVIFIPYSFLIFTSMNYPIGFNLNSLIPPLIYMSISGVVIANIFKRFK